VLMLSNSKVRRFGIFLSTRKIRREPKQSGWNTNIYQRVKFNSFMAGSLGFQVRIMSAILYLVTEFVRVEAGFDSKLETWDNWVHALNLVR